jgi:hypothetical protein
MYRRALTRVGVPAVVAAVLLTAGPTRAQQYEGGRPGGGDPAGASASSGGSSTRALRVILTASGVPNRNGQVTWPAAFHVLGADPLARQLEAQLELAVEQVTAGGVNPLLLDEIRLTVQALRRALQADKAERFSLTDAVYEDAERFLRKIERTPRLLLASPPAGSGASAR